MSSYDQTLFNVNPYYDDFSEDKKFLRMLFRPGYAVQARELTQLQTILQNQIERFGNNIFRDGSNIIGGEISTQTLNFVRIYDTTNTVPYFKLSETDLLGHRLTQNDAFGNAVASASVVKVLQPYSASDPYVVAIVSYLTGQEFTGDSILECDNPDKSFTVTVAPNIATVPAVGKAKIVAVSDGIYYINGYFVRTSEQLEPAYVISNEIRNFVDPSGVMGLNAVSVIVTEKDDYTLKDPASGSYNYNAPGSHRYKIDLQLKFVDQIVDDNFIELVSYTNGEIVKKTDETQYGDLVNLFAQRTYDESGNYTVKPFDISFRENGNTFYADIGSGKAYVYGYEYETKFKDIVSIPKARTTASYADVEIDNYFGNYVLGKYSPGTNSERLNQLFSTARTSLNERTMAFQVYGATAPATPSTYSTTAVFEGLLLGVEPIEVTQYSTQGITMDFKAYLSEITPLNADGMTGVTLDPLNLYIFSPTTGISTKILSNISLFRDTQIGSVSMLPKFSDSEDQTLLFQVNGNTPSTMVKEINSLYFVSDVSRGFVVDAITPIPQISHGQGSNYAWSFRDGFVPSGSDIMLDETDGYYLVYEMGTALPRGTVIRIVGENITVPSTQTKAVAKITGDGDFVQIMSSLPFGSYYLVGKVKALNQNIPQNPIGKVRIKTLTTATEVISDQTNTLNTFKRVIKKSGSGDIVSMYFVLNRADVTKINAVTDGSGNNISDEFLFDSGQRDTVYLLGRLYVKPDYFDKYAENETFQISVSYSYYQHSGYGPITRESYSGISYDDIQVYVSPRTGKSIHLANALDYRYLSTISGYVAAGSTSEDAGQTFSTPTFNTPIIRYSNGSIPGKSTISNNHTSYLPRLDKLVVSRNISAEDAEDLTTLQRVGGVPSDSPVLPEDLTDSMTLFVLSIPAYTFNPNDIKAQSVNNNRYTMRDIGDISSRVDTLEKNAQLTDLELSVITKDIKTSTNTDAIKRAILVDTFDGHVVGDVSVEDYRCSIDHERGILRPSFASNSYEFEYNGFDPGITLTTDNILCADYTGTTFIYQDRASDVININSFCLPNWVGNIKLSKSSDYWYDTVTRPVVKNNDYGTNEAWQISNMNGANGHGSQWNDWESIWNGIPIDPYGVEGERNANFFALTRQRGKTFAVEPRWMFNDKVKRFTVPFEKLRKLFSVYPSINKKDYYINYGINTMLNRSVVPFMRENTMTINVYNMKPGTNVYLFMDNISIDKYCTLDGYTGPFQTDIDNGSIENIVFSYPDGMFEAGEKIIRAIDDSGNNVENATTIAEATFYATGINSENPYGITSIRPVDIRKKTPNSSKVITNPLYRRKSINTTKYNQWIDPVAQTFEITENNYPNGIFLESIDLYFASRDKQLPVTVEICPVQGGIPNPSIILPFSTVVLSPSNVNRNPDKPVATNFKFTSPVYLAPGAYAILVKSNSPKYTLHVANIGKADIVTGKKITSTFGGGSLFKAQNSSEPIGDNNTDLTFKLNRCKFDTIGGSIILNHVQQETDFVANLIQPNVFAFVPPNSSVTSKVVVGVNEYSATVNRNFNLPSAFVIDESSNFDLVLTPSSTTDDSMTFMIDMEKTNVVVAKNIINGSENSTNVEQAVASGRNDDTARYISKRVMIPNGQYAKELKVIVDANIPKDTFIRVYAKAFNSELTSNEAVGYKRMNAETNSEFFIGGNFTNSLNANDFREITYSVVPTTDKFNVFAVKICLYSLNTSIVPTIKNLRVVAIE